MDEHGFQIAFTLSDSLTGEVKHDPKFIDWLVILVFLVSIISLVFLN